MSLRSTGRYMILLAFWTLVFGLVATDSRAANIAAGKPAFASINNADAGRVTDNDQNTIWTATGSPSAGLDRIGVDLGAASPIKTVRVYWGDTRPTAFTIDVATTVVTDPTSPDLGSGDWTTVHTYSGGDNGTTPPSHPYVADFSASSYSYRFVRVNATTAPSDAWGIRELQVLDAPLPKITGTALFGGTGVANALVRLTGPSGSFLVKTGSSGAFSFANLDPGTYRVSASAPGRYAPVSASAVVAAANIAQNLTFTTAVVNSTAPVTAYSQDFIASATKPTDMNAAVDPLAIQAEQLPPGEAVWTTNTALPTGATVGPDLPTTLKFFMPPTADGKNNVLTALNVTIPFAPANYTAVYFLQTSLEGAFYTTATLHYADGTSELATTSDGNTLYGFSRGDDPAAPATALRAGLPGVDEVVAIGFNEMYGGEDFAEVRPWNLFVHEVKVNSAKVLTSIEFDGGLGGPGSTTLSKGLILGWSADSLAAPGATGSISGTIKAPNGTPVAGAIVNLNSYRIVTDATGTYSFKGLPAGEWTVSARKPAFYGVTTRTVTLTAGQVATGQDIQFAAPAAIMATGIGAPQFDLVSSDANFDDFQFTGWMPGREYFPTGLYKPSMGGNPPYYDVQAGAPENLPFLFTDFGDTQVTPGTVGYPVGGTPNVQILNGSTFLAPPVKTTAVYLATIGAEGGNNINPILVYTDGTVENRRMSIGDWFQSPTPDEFPYIAMHGRHARNGEANFGAGTNIRLNSIIIPVNPNKTLKHIEFGAQSGPWTFPIVLAVSWETETPQPEPSDLVVTVKKSDGTAAARAMVAVGPYYQWADDSGTARFIALPANLPMAVAAYLPGITRQARVDHTMLAGRTIAGGNPDTVAVTLPSAAPTFVHLPLLREFDPLAMPDMPGDYKTGAHNDRGFQADQMPATGAIASVANIPFKMPIKETFYNNAFRPNGQTMNIVPGNYSSLDMLITSIGTGDVRPSYITLKYADGTSEKAQFSSADWVRNWAAPEQSNRTLFYRLINPGLNNPFLSTGRYGPGDSDDLDIAFLPMIVPVNAAKTLVGIEWLPMLGAIQDFDYEVLAITLEANTVTGTSGTITGRVIGKPMGAAAAGPLPITQVILDGAHAAYTDASGAFSIPDAPLGAGNLKVIPYGTGILTKSFPVTVTAGTVNVGDLNVGSSVTQVSIVMGPTNDTRGIRLLEPAVMPSGNYNWNEAHTAPVTIGGKAARETVNNRMYFDIDDGWLWRGMQGTNGLTIVNRGTPTQDITKLTPTIYMRIEYYDRGTDIFRIEYNRIEEWTYKAVSTDPGFQTTRLTNMWARPNPEAITKTGTDTWKTLDLTFDSVTMPMGAYNGQHLQGDFLFEDEGASEIIHKVTLSTTPDFSVPSPAADILRAAGGLDALTTPEQRTALDLNGDGKVTLQDAALAARQAQGL